MLDPVWGLILPLGYDSSAEVGVGNPLEGRRALARLERQYLDAQRAVDHESLHDLSRETLARVERARKSLNAIERNLPSVLATAQDINRQRERRAKERPGSGTGDVGRGGRGCSARCGRRAS